MNPGSHEAQRFEPGTRLGKLARLAAGAGAAELARDADDLATRIAEGRFHVAVVGQFKRGKSTLLNALIQDSVLPTGVIPVTSAITVVRHGHARVARVWYEDGRSEAVDPSGLGAYVSEAENPENAKGVRAVEVFVPAPLLARGTCLVDTPGLGSVFGGNTAVTRAFLPHVDAAIVVVGADPPVSGEEARIVEECAQHVRHLVIVLNKADRLPEREREGARFTAQVLSKRRHGCGREGDVARTSAACRGVRAVESELRQIASVRRELEALLQPEGENE